MNESDVNGTGLDNLSENELLERLQKGKDQILEQLRKRIVGQDEVIEKVLIALFAALIAGIYPAYRLSKLKIASSLHEE